MLLLSNVISRLLLTLYMIIDIFVRKIDIVITEVALLTVTCYLLLHVFLAETRIISKLVIYAFFLTSCR